jgi:hypothetical protein
MQWFNPTLRFVIFKSQKRKEVDCTPPKLVIVETDQSIMATNDLDYSALCPSQTPYEKKIQGLALDLYRTTENNIKVSQ